MVKYISAVGSLAVIYSDLTARINGSHPAAFHTDVGVPLPFLISLRGLCGVLWEVHTVACETWGGGGAVLICFFSNEEHPQRQH